MIKTYLRIAFRNLLRHRIYSLINVSGLSIGIASCLLIFIVVRYELSYDKFQANYDRTYRVVSTGKRADGTQAHNPGVPVPAYEALKADFPQIEKIAPVNSSSQTLVAVLGNNPNSEVALSKKFIEERISLFTYPEYFDIFNARFLAGNASVLKDPESMILDKSAADKYFGNWQTAMGQYLKIDNNMVLKVAGIIEDAPLNSDFPVPMFFSYEMFKKFPDVYGYTTDWGSLSSNHQVYILLPKNVTTASVQSLMPAFVKKHIKDERRVQMLQPLKDMHFDIQYGTFGDHSVSRSILWTLSLIAVLIIIMASINFVNLSTAQAVGRSKEVGIRKVLGSQRVQLILQVMGETFLIVLFSVLIAGALAKLAIPFLTKIATVPDNLPVFTLQNLLFLATVLVIVTLLSGIYPALIVSGFKPAMALKNKISSASIGGISLRRILVVTQFAISQVLIIGTIVAVSQMNYVRDADLGFNKEAVLVMPAYTDSSLISRMKPLKEQLLGNPDVISVSFGSDEVSSNNNWSSNFAFDHKPDQDFDIYHKFGDEDYIKTFGLQLLAGRNLEPSDTIREAIINETLLHKLGLKDPSQAIGKDIRIGSGKWLPVVGVVKDFKTNSLRESVKPIMIASRRSFYFNTAVKVKTANLSNTVAHIQKLWEKTYPEYAFTSHFVEETIDRFYQQEAQLSLLYKIFAGIAIFISCLGLYGLVSFMAAQKTKEVGIRKVLGASVGNIVYMFSKEFTILITIAFVVAAPVAWYFMNNWLQNFEFRIKIGMGVFALAIIASILIAWFTVGYKAIRAALVNPVKSLRSE